MGSTAWAAAVDTVLVFRRTERCRTLQSHGRIGENLPETIVEMDPDTRRTTPSGTKAEVHVATVKVAIERYLRRHAEAGPGEWSADEATIEQNVEGRTMTIRKALRELVAERRVERLGTGRKGDSYRYRFSRSHVPTHGSERENEEFEVVPEPAPKTTGGREGSPDSNGIATPTADGRASNLEAHRASDEIAVRAYQSQRNRLPRKDGTVAPDR